jgi:hypothetical protein
LCRTQGAHARLTPGGIEVYKFVKNAVVVERTRLVFKHRMWVQFTDEAGKVLWTVLSDRKGDKLAKFVRVAPGGKFDSPHNKGEASDGSSGSGESSPAYLQADDRTMTVRGVAARTALENHVISEEEYRQLQEVLERARLAEEVEAYVPLASQAAEFEDASFTAGLSAGAGHTLDTNTAGSRAGVVSAYDAGYQTGLKHAGAPEVRYDTNGGEQSVGCRAVVRGAFVEVGSDVVMFGVITSTCFHWGREVCRRVAGVLRTLTLFSCSAHCVGGTKCNNCAQGGFRPGPASGTGGARRCGGGELSAAAAAAAAAANNHAAQHCNHRRHDEHNDRPHHNHLQPNCHAACFSDTLLRPRRERWRIGGVSARRKRFNPALSR